MAQLKHKWDDIHKWDIHKWDDSGIADGPRKARFLIRLPGPNSRMLECLSAV